MYTELLSHVVTGNPRSTAKACAASLLEDDNSTPHEDYELYYSNQIAWQSTAELVEVDARVFNYTFRTSPASVAFSREEAVMLQRSAQGPLISTLPVEANLAAGDVEISDGSPFFDAITKQPFLSAPPQALINELRATGCKWAWKRNLHQKSQLDVACDAIAEAFWSATPGGVLGLFDAITQDRGLLIAEPTYALLTDTSLVVNRHPKHGNESQAAVDLRSLGWWSKARAPPVIEARAGFSKEGLAELAAHGGPRQEPFVAHACGEWSYKASDPHARARATRIRTHTRRPHTRKHTHTPPAQTRHPHRRATRTHTLTRTDRLHTHTHTRTRTYTRTPSHTHARACLPACLLACLPICLLA